MQTVAHSSDTSAEVQLPASVRRIYAQHCVLSKITPSAVHNELLRTSDDGPGAAAGAQAPAHAGVEDGSAAYGSENKRCQDSCEEAHDEVRKGG